MKSGVFISILILALTGYGLYRLFLKEKEVVFQANLITVDTSGVNSILLSNNPFSGGELSFLREDKDWIISNEKLHIKANSLTMQKLLSSVLQIKTNEVVATDPKNWKIYGVDGVQGIRVRLYNEKKKLEDFVIGKSDINPQTQAPISYLRLSGENEVYVVAGDLLAQFNQNFTNSRSRLILSLDSSVEITDLEYQLPDTSWNILKTPEGWKSGDLLLDSLEISRYLQQLQHLSGDAFADHFDEVQGSKYLYQTVTIQGKNLTEPVVITCYRDTTLKVPFILHSTQNQEAFFASDSAGIYHKIFKQWN